MKIFGRQLTIGKQKALQGVGGYGGWWNVIREPFSGAWQRNVAWRHDHVLSNTTMFACITLIASDISKLRWMLMKPIDEAKQIWEEGKSPAYSGLLKQPNRYQNPIQFREQWMISKLSRGNTYALKQRDLRGIVVALYILDPTRVFPLVADDGSVYYQLSTDNLSGISLQTITVPASEIIHDRFNCLFHPLMGLSPIFACGLPALQSLNIMSNYTQFFHNQAMPAGILTAPGSISQPTADRLAKDWSDGFSGSNAGKVAVLGDGLKFEKMVMTAADAQVIDQLKFSDEKICSAFHVPAYKVGVGQQPTYQNIGVLQQDYYNTCLQKHVEDMEECLDLGLALPDEIGIQLNLDGLTRLDPAAQMTTASEGVKGTILSPNEGRRRVGLPPVAGGDAPLAQQQNYSLSALAKRDAQPDPFVTNKPATNVEMASALPSDPSDSTTPAILPADEAAAKEWRRKAFDSFMLEMAE